MNDVGKYSSVDARAPALWINLSFNPHASIVSIRKTCSTAYSLSSVVVYELIPLGGTVHRAMTSRTLYREFVKAS